MGGNSGNGNWNVVHVCLGVGGAVLFVSGVIIAKRKKRQKVEVGQKRRDERYFGKQGEKLFSGLRVVDIASHIAAPGAARVLGDLGAEVIKVEPPMGDSFRNTLLDFEKPRTFSTVFATSNFSKSGMVLDFKQESEKAKLLELLKDADVLIVNTRQVSLSKTGLDYETLSKKFPHLIYAQVTAWGSKGEDAAKAGFDIGAFWASTGLASLVNHPKMFSTYCPATGDLTTAQILLGGIEAALYQRFKTGRGRFVTTSLNHAGTWIAGPQIVKAKPVPVDEPPNYESAKHERIVDVPYKSSDDKRSVFIAFKGSFDKEKEAAKILCQAVGATSCSQGAIQSSLSKLSVEEIENKLAPHSDTLDVHRLERFLTDMIKDVEEEVQAPDFQRATGTHDRVPPGFDDHAPTKVSSASKYPAEFSLFPNQGSDVSAPELGEHTDDIVERGWLNRRLEIPSVSADDNNNKPLQGLVVIEVSSATSHDCSVAAGTKLLLDMGATVHKVLEGSNSLKELEPTVYDHFNRGKEDHPISDLENLLQKGSIIVTDKNIDELGLKEDDLSKNGITVVKLVANMKAKKQDFVTRFDMFCNAPFAQMMDPYKNHSMGLFPAYVLESFVGVYLMSATCAAAFHYERTGQGQLVKVSLERIGHWNAHTMLSFFMRDQNMPPITMSTKAQRCCPTPLFDSYETKDGAYLQMLGLNTGRHLPVFLKVMPWMRLRFYPGLLYTLFFKVIPKRGHVLEKAVPLFIFMGSSIENELKKYTWSELREMFGEKVWYSPVRVPGQVLSYQGAWDNQVLEKDKSNQVHITCPLQFI